MANSASAPLAPSSQVPAKKTSKPAAKSAVKAAAKPTTKPAKPAVDTVPLIGKTVIPETEKANKPVKIVEADKQLKIKKTKLVRDSFTIPKDEYQVIDALKQRSAKLGQPMKKSELLRAGIKLLNSLDDKQFLQALTEVPTIKTGRPKKSK
jgi:hypothetical protein